MKTNITHEQMVALLGKDGTQIMATMTPEKAHLWHMATGIATEAGELLDAVKKHVMYNQPLKVRFKDGDGSVEEELGDLEFYMEGLRRPLEMTRDETRIANMSKLAKRYGDDFGYTDKKAQERKDKQ